MGIVRIIKAAVNYYHAESKYLDASSNLENARRKIIAPIEIVNGEDFNRYKSGNHDRRKYYFCKYPICHKELWTVGDQEAFHFNRHDLVCGNFEDGKPCENKDCVTRQKDNHKYQTCYSNYTAAKTHKQRCWKAIFTRNPKK
ncbi:MAG: hypothetical protein FWE50_01400 [Alphaproteobacteria bacterium]|nr:hypothetical protein [Alphaproteobacteria bacterium]